jgi:hypothetical protein
MRVQAVFARRDGHGSMGEDRASARRDRDASR